MCSYIFHGVDIQVIKQHSDTSVIYYPNRFPTSFNQTLPKPADSERNLLSFSALCLCLSPQLHSRSALLSFSLLTYSYFPKRLFHMCLGFGGAEPQKITKEQIKWSKAERFPPNMKDCSYQRQRGLSCVLYCGSRMPLSVTYIISPVRC